MSPDHFLRKPEGDFIPNVWDKVAFGFSQKVVGAHKLVSCGLQKEKDQFTNPLVVVEINEKSFVYMYMTSS